MNGGGTASRLQRVALLVLVAGIAAGIAVASAASSSGGGVVNGVGPASGGVIGSAVVPGSLGSVLNFDDVQAPCTFAQTSALQSYHGVTFAGDVPRNGGGILNECGNFGVSGYSPPNFLAFNCGSSYMDGGVPKLPETITFPRKFHVSLKVGSGSDAGKTLTITGRRESHDVTLTSAMQTVVFKKKTKKLTLTSSTVCILVVDDITFG